MTDVVDQAQEFEEMRRQEALRAVLVEARPPASAGRFECIDCADPIEPERISAWRAATRCTECQETADRRQRQFARS